MSENKTKLVCIHSTYKKHLLSISHAKRKQVESWDCRKCVGTYITIVRGFVKIVQFIFHQPLDKKNTVRQIILIFNRHTVKSTKRAKRGGTFLKSYDLQFWLCGHCIISGYDKSSFLNTSALRQSGGYCQVRKRVVFFLSLLFIMSTVLLLCSEKMPSIPRYFFFLHFLSMTKLFFCF